MIENAESAYELYDIALETYDIHIDDIFDEASSLAEDLKPLTLSKIGVRV